MKKTKVAILGTVPNSRIVAPYEDPTWDIWCCSGGNSQAGAPPRVDEWFELHSIVDLQAPENKGWWPPYAAWLQAQKFPVWMQEPNEWVPRSVTFPRRELMAKFGPNKTKTNWFTSSPAWMFGFALHRGYTTIGVFGVDMAAAEEHYTGQKAGLLRWFEIGRELGIQVIVPLESTLAFHYPLYGYAESSRTGRALLARELEQRQRVQHMKNQQAQLSQQIAFHEGVMETLIFDRRTYVSGVSDAEIQEDAFVDVTTASEIDPTISNAVPREIKASVELPVAPPPQIIAPTPLPDQVPPPSPAAFPDNPHAGLLKKAAKARNGPVPKEE